MEKDVVGGERERERENKKKMKMKMKTKTKTKTKKCFFLLFAKCRKRERRKTGNITRKLPLILEKLKTDVPQ